jgi:hypothetical protein
MFSLRKLVIQQLAACLQFVSLLLCEPVHSLDATRAHTLSLQPFPPAAARETSQQRCQELEVLKTCWRWSRSSPARCTKPKSLLQREAELSTNHKNFHFLWLGIQFSTLALTHSSHVHLEEVTLPRWVLSCLLF